MYTLFKLYGLHFKNLKKTNLDGPLYHLISTFFDMASTKFFSSVNLWRLNSSRVLKRYCSGASSDTPQCGVKLEKVKEKPTTENDQGKKKGLVIGVYENGDKFELTSVAQEIDEKSGGKICKYLNEMSCNLKLGEAFVVTDVLEEFGAVAISSLGKKDPGYNQSEALDETRENVRVCVGAGVRALLTRSESVLVAAGAAPDAAAEAAHLASWRFDEFKSCGAKSPHMEVSLQGPGQESWERGSAFGSAQNWARYLTDMPANKMTPIDVAQAALDELCPLGVRVEAHEVSWIRAQRMEAVLAAASGACEPPMLLECHYQGGGGRAPVLLAAKGVTFDSGGLCLRKAEEMRESPGSMAGAAVVLATLRILAELKVPINVSAVIPLYENMVSGSCMKVGDVVRSLNGLSVQMQCTAQAGRAALADALVYGQAKYKPALVIDVATLTRGVSLATGGAAFGAFCSSSSSWDALRAAGAASGDRGWRLPLWDYYGRLINDDPAVDLKNRGPGTAAPCVGAAFLKNFVCGPWMHIDMSGVTRGSPGCPYLSPGRASGRPTRTLAEFLTAAGLASGTAGTVIDTDLPAPSNV